MVTKKKKALVKSEPRAVAVSDMAITGLALLAGELSKPATPAKLAQYSSLVAKLESDLEACKKVVQSQIRQMVQVKGEPVPNTKGSLKYVAEGWEFPIRPQSTQPKADKVSTLLRGKGLELETGMDAEVSYKPNPLRLASLVEAKKITQDELDACKPELSYVVMPPRKVEP